MYIILREQHNLRVDYEDFVTAAVKRNSLLSKVAAVATG